MPDCGVQCLWFAFVCILIGPHPPTVAAAVPGYRPRCIEYVGERRGLWWAWAALEEASGGPCLGFEGPFVWSGGADAGPKSVAFGGTGGGGGGLAGGGGGGQ